MAVTRRVPREWSVMGPWDKPRPTRRDQVMEHKGSEIKVAIRMLPGRRLQKPLQQQQLRRRNVPFEEVNHRLIVQWGHSSVYPSQIQYEKRVSTSSSGSILFVNANQHTTLTFIKNIYSLILGSFIARPFEWVILSTIFANCVALAVYTPYPLGDTNQTNLYLVSIFVKP